MIRVATTSVSVPTEDPSIVNAIKCEQKAIEYPSDNNAENLVAILTDSDPDIPDNKILEILTPIGKENEQLLVDNRKQ